MSASQSASARRARAGDERPRSAPILVWARGSRWVATAPGYRIEAFVGGEFECIREDEPPRIWYRPLAWNGGWFECIGTPKADFDAAARCCQAHADREGQAMTAE